VMSYENLNEANEKSRQLSRKDSRYLYAAVESIEDVNEIIDYILNGTCQA
jgi:hypothetical protein